VPRASPACGQTLTKRLESLLCAASSPASWSRSVIVHGEATAIDRFFAEACGELGVEQEAHQARWEELDHPDAVIRYEKRNRPDNANAGPIGTVAVVAAGAEMCLAFHLAISASKGAKDRARRAIESGIPTYPIKSEATQPKRPRSGDARLR
jgi:hypothetical protein